MSTETIRSDRTTSLSVPARLLRTTLRTVTAIAFWLAVALPFCYLPLLATGLDSATTQSAFGVLLTLNAVCLVFGHAHNRD